MSKWQTIKLGDFLKLYRIECKVQDQAIYKQVTISKTRGVFFRGEKQGKNIGRKRQFLIDLDTYPNTLLFTRQGVFDGSIGIAPMEVNQCIVTENMPMMSVDTSIVEMEYLKKLLISEYLFEKIRKLKIVGSAQKSIHERDLLKIEIELPAKSEQVEICKKFNILDVEHNELTGETSNQQNLLKKLRQQILQDAIEGKLTKDWREQNPNVEPASELLKRIEAEKQQLIKDKKIKNQKSLSAITDGEKLFELPENWKWCRFQNITTLITCGIASTPQYLPKGRIFLSAKNVKPYSFIPEEHKFVSEETYQKIVKNAKPEMGDILLTRVGAGIGEAAIIDQEIDFAFYVSLTLIKFPHQLISSKFILNFLNSNAGIKNAISFTSGKSSSQGNLNVGNVRSFLIPVPPLQEQKEIVRKVEKLFTICSQLEKQITGSKNNIEKLSQSVLKKAFSTPEETLCI